MGWRIVEVSGKRPVLVYHRHRDWLPGNMPALLVVGHSLES